MIHNAFPVYASPSPSPPPSPVTFSRRSPATSSEHSHELRPLISGSMEDRKELEDVNVDNGFLRQGVRPAVLDDPELEGLSLYEKKVLLVNRELDSHGMGKYQWYIFFLCGFGYLLDLLYAQAFGLVEPAIQREFGFGGSYSILLLSPRTVAHHLSRS